MVNLENSNIEQSLQIGDFKSNEEKNNVDIESMENNLFDLIDDENFSFGLDDN